MSDLLAFTTTTGSTPVSVSVYTSKQLHKDDGMEGREREREREKRLRRSVGTRKYTQLFRRPRLTQEGQRSVVPLVNHLVAGVASGDTPDAFRYAIGRFFFECGRREGGNVKRSLVVVVFFGSQSQRMSPLNMPGNSVTEQGAASPGSGKNLAFAKTTRTSRTRHTVFIFVFSLDGRGDSIRVFSL